MRLPPPALAALSALTLTAAPAGAFTINFADLADSMGEQGATSFVFANVDGSGITLTITARDLTDGAGTSEGGTPNPYLDANLGGLPGGLGVCQEEDPGCEGNSDDNLGIGTGMGEVLILLFSQSVILTEVTFNNGIHEKNFVGTTGIHVGAGNPTTAETFGNLYTAAATLNPNLAGQRYSFVAEESFVGATIGDPSRLYIESITFIPEPSTAILLGVGLLLLARRRR